MVVRDTIQCGYSKEVQVSFSFGVYSALKQLYVCHHPLKDIFTITSISYMFL